MNSLVAILVVTAGTGAIWFSQASTAPAKEVRARWSLTSPRAVAARPVLVELYQSQGCSSCPPANANLNAIVDRRDVVALSFGVTY